MDDTQLKNIIRSITSCFENSSKRVQYEYIEALGDGRGYTAGSAGFTTGTGDLYEVMKTYVAMPNSASIHPDLMQTLADRAKDESGSIEGLETLPKLWRVLCTDPTFIKAQDAVSDKLYMKPALAYAATNNVRSNLGKAIMYDTIIQHGDGDDPDSIGAILKRTTPRGKMSESTWLYEFLLKRRDDLCEPFNKDTTDEWKESVDRVDALIRLLDAHELDLRSPFTLKVFGSVYNF